MRPVSITIAVLANALFLCSASSASVTAGNTNDSTVLLVRMLDTSIARTYDLGKMKSGAPLKLRRTNLGVGYIDGLRRQTLSDLELQLGPSRTGFGWRTFDRQCIVGFDEPNIFHIDVSFDPKDNRAEKYRVRGVGLRTTTTSSWDDWHAIEPPSVVPDASKKSKSLEQNHSNKALVRADVVHSTVRRCVGHYFA